MDAEAVCHAKDDNKLEHDKMHQVKAGSVEPFRFLDLPPEVRNKIYQSCVCEAPGLYKDDLFPELPPIFHDLRQAPITRVNKQIRDETLPIFYGNHKFLIELPELPWDWEHIGPRREDYQDPTELLLKRLSAFAPGEDSNLQANSLRFLSELTVSLEMEDSWQWRLRSLGFVMSTCSEEPVSDNTWEHYLKITGLDWNDCDQVREVFLTALDDCPFFHERRGLFDVSEFRVPGNEVGKVVSALSTLMCRIAKLCPQLTSNVSVFVDPGESIDAETWDQLVEEYGVEDAHSYWVLCV